MATANQQIRRVLGVLEFSFDFLNPVTKTKFSVLIQFWTPRACSCMVSIAFATEAWKEYRTEKAASRAEHEWRQRASLVVSNIKCVCVSTLLKNDPQFQRFKWFCQRSSVLPLLDFYSPILCQSFVGPPLIPLQGACAVRCYWCRWATKLGVVVPLRHSLRWWPIG